MLFDTSTILYFVLFQVDGNSTILIILYIFVRQSVSNSFDTCGLRFLFIIDWVAFDLISRSIFVPLINYLLMMGTKIERAYIEGAYSLFL